MNRPVIALVVTYNRKALLGRCLDALVGQSHPPDRVLIVDNASTDGTREWLAQAGWLAREDVELLALSENTGGAGGFSAGIAHAVERGASWVWLMDDDAEPAHEALATLLEAATDPNDLYGSVAVAGDRLAWPMAPHGAPADGHIHYVEQAPTVPVDVAFIPFLGLLVSRELVGAIGVPDPGFFLAADDVEYCMRARRHGARTWLVARSRIEHPASERYGMQLTPRRRFESLRLPPWKRYYDVRNRLFIARAYYGAATWYKTIPGQFMRLFLTLLNEPRRGAQLKAFVAGMVDGLAGRKGRRHERWGISP